MKMKQGPIKPYPVPALRVVVNNGKINEKPLTENKNGAELKKNGEKKAKPKDNHHKQDRNIPEFYQHVIKPKKYDFF